MQIIAVTVWMKIGWEVEIHENLGDMIMRSECLNQWSV